MTTTHITKEQTIAPNQETVALVSNFHILHEIGLFFFSMVFIAIFSHILNESAVLTFNEQLSIINKPNFSGFLMILFGVLFASKILYDCVSIAIHGEEIASQFSSIWGPIRFAIFTTIFIPFEQNGLVTSPIVETIKWIIKLVTN